MASNQELHDLLAFDESTNLRQRVAAATLKAVKALLDEAMDAVPTPAQLARKRFATSFFRLTIDRSLETEPSNRKYSQNNVFEGVYRYVLMDNAGATVAQITGANDTQIDSAVRNAIDVLAGDYSGA